MSDVFDNLTLADHIYVFGHKSSNKIPTKTIDLNEVEILEKLYSIAMEKLIKLKVLADTNITNINNTLLAIESLLKRYKNFEKQQQLGILNNSLDKLEDLERQYNNIIGKQFTNSDVLFNTGMEYQAFKLSIGQYIPFSNVIETLFVDHALSRPAEISVLAETYKKYCEKAGIVMNFIDSIVLFSTTISKSESAKIARNIQELVFLYKLSGQNLNYSEALVKMKSLNIV